MSLDHNTIREQTEKGNTSLGIELGSIRVKVVLIRGDHTPIASGSHDWENRYVDYIWTYTPEDIWTDIQDCYAAMAADVKGKYGVTLTTVGPTGSSAMMHDYMAFNKEGDLLVPFRTWRSTIADPASEKLTQVFRYNVPQRWSIARLYQAILNREERVEEIDYLITLGGYVHWKLAGRKVLEIDGVAGMFPVDIHTKDFDQKGIDQFGELVAGEHFPQKLRDTLPRTLVVGEDTGTLTEEGARSLGISGNPKAGIPVYPPEGDAGTSATVTNGVAVRTGNMPAGTSVFAMVVLEKELEYVYPEIDLVTTPASDMVVVVHCGNCTSDLNTWVNLFKRFLETMGMKADMDDLFGTPYNKALEGDPGYGDLLAYNYFSREHITHFGEEHPLFVRMPDSRFSFANFMRVHLHTSLGALRTGADILLREEHVKVDALLGHGGLPKAKGVGQRILAGAMNAPVSVMETAGKDGAWGIAPLAAFIGNKKESRSLDRYLTDQVFEGDWGICVKPIKEDVKGFEAFMERYAQRLATEQAATDRIGQTE